MEPIEAVVQNLSKIWGCNRFLRELGIFSFYWRERRLRDDPHLEDIADAQLKRLREFDLVPREYIDRLAAAAPESVNVAIAAIESLVQETAKDVFSALGEIEPSPEKAASWLETEFRYDLEPYESLIWKDSPESKAKDRVRDCRDRHSETRPDKRSRQSILCSQMSDYIIALGLSGGNTDNYVRHRTELSG